MKIIDTPCVFPVQDASFFKKLRRALKIKTVLCGEEIRSRKWMRLAQQLQLFGGPIDKSA
jgi:hypothetical protein